MLAQALLVGPIARTQIDEPALLHDVAEAVDHPADGRVAVAAGAAGLLVVALDRLGQVDVRHEAHVGLVDAHAERDGGDHHDAVLAEEPGLVRGAYRRVETRVIRQRIDALGPEEVGGLLDGLAAERIDDARRPRGLRADERQQLPPRVDLRLDAVLDVRPVEARDEVLRLGQPQSLGDLAVRGGASPSR